MLSALSTGQGTRSPVPVELISGQWLQSEGFRVQQLRGEPGIMEEQIQRSHIVTLWTGPAVFGEQRTERGFRHFTRPTGTITFSPPRVIPEFRAKTPFDVLVCMLNPEFLRAIEEEMEPRPRHDLLMHTLVSDQALTQIMNLLATETAEQGAMGKLYLDHLAHALVARLFMLNPNAQAGESARSQRSELPRHLLARVVERMHNLDYRASLQSLSEETGYSRSHFLRMFRVSTGKSPHQYLMELRLKRAEELLRQSNASLIEIATECGFSSHAHLTRMFRRHVGVTPSEFRRSL